MSERAPAATEELRVLVSDAQALSAELQAHGFDVERWGEGPTKTVDALWQEISEGETELVEVEGELVRRTCVAGVNVFAELPDGSRYRLREDRQVFRNGAERQRSLPTSLGEKVKPGETTEVAVRRAIHEELGIAEVAGLTELGTERVVRRSQTYGGMQTELEMRLAEILLAPADFRPEGYIEHQDDKSVYFVWEAV
jgi:hypothetical protein